MNEILADFSSNFAHLSIADYLIVFLLVIYAIIGLKRGFALELIHLIWLILAFVFAGNFYQSLGEVRFLWFLNDYHFLNFCLLFVLFFAFKILLYKFLQKIAKIQGPCPLNKFLAIFLGLVIVLNISWALAHNITYIGSFHSLISHEALRITLAFLFNAIVIIIGIVVFAKTFAVKVNTNHPCPLLVALMPLNAALNANGIEGSGNNFFGLLLGALKGGIIAILLIIMLHQYNITARGVIANNVSNVVIGVQNILSQHLTFIKIQKGLK